MESTVIPFFNYGNMYQDKYFPRFSVRYSPAKNKLQNNKW